MGKQRDGNPRNMHNWGLVCSHCGAELHETETLNLADGHFAQEHPGEKIALTTIWKGKGPRPRKGPFD